MHLPGGVVYHGRRRHCLDPLGIPARPIRAGIARYKYRAELEAAIRSGLATRFDKLGITQEQIEQCVKNYGWPTCDAQVRLWLEELGGRR